MYNLYEFYQAIRYIIEWSKEQYEVHPWINWIGGLILMKNGSI